MVGEKVWNKVEIKFDREGQEYRIPPDAQGEVIAGPEELLNGKVYVVVQFPGGSIEPIIPSAVNYIAFLDELRRDDSWLEEMLQKIEKIKVYPK